MRGDDACFSELPEHYSPDDDLCWAPTMHSGTWLDVRSVCVMGVHSWSLPATFGNCMCCSLWRLVRNNCPTPASKTGPKNILQTSRRSRRRAAHFRLAEQKGSLGRFVAFCCLVRVAWVCRRLCAVLTPDRKPTKTYIHL